MKKFFVPVLLIIIASSAFRLAHSTITRSVISFQIKNLGINTKGSISGLQADAQFNPADLSSSAIEASVDVNTINTDNSSRDGHLKNEDYFDVTRFPRITLKSVSFKHKSGDNYSGVFNLTIKDKTKTVEIPFTYTEKDKTGTFKSSFKINRLDYGVGSSSMILANEVVVNIEAGVAY